MQLGHPSALLALLLLLPVGVLLVRARRLRSEAAARFAEPAMRHRLLPAPYRARLRGKELLFLVAVVLLILAAAQPRFGLYYEVVPQHGLDLMVVLDVSRSMGGDDVTPSRLERAKSDIRDLLTRLDGGRAGLVVFAGQPVLKVPLTNDQELYRLILEEVELPSVACGGTRIGDGLRKGLEALPRQAQRDQVLVLLSDGEDQDSQPEEAAREAAQRGVKLVTIGLGDAQVGARIAPVAPRGQRRGQAASAEQTDQDHWSRLQEGLLKELALVTQGAYVPAGTSTYDLGQVYEDYLAGLSQGPVSAGPQPRYAEQYQLFVALALGLLLLEMGISPFPRPTEAEPCAESLP